MRNCMRCCIRYFRYSLKHASFTGNSPTASGVCIEGAPRSMRVLRGESNNAVAEKHFGRKRFASETRFHPRESFRRS